MEDVPEVDALTKHFKSVVNQCVQGTWQSYGDFTTIVGFKSLPNKNESETFKVQKWMARIDIHYDRGTYFLNRLTGMAKRWCKATSADDDLRRDVWGLQPVQWNGDGDDEKSIVEEEKEIMAEEAKEIEEQVKRLEEEEREAAADDEDAGVVFYLQEPLREGDTVVRCRWFD